MPRVLPHAEEAPLDDKSLQRGSHVRVRSLSAALVLLAVVMGVAGSAPGRALAWAVGGPLLPNGSAQGSGYAYTSSSVGATVQVSLQGARPGTTYAIFTCVGLYGGDFNCTNRNLAPAVSQVVVAPKGIAPVVVTLVQQGTLQTDAFGQGSASLSLSQGLYPDMVHSVYNVVQLVDTADASDSYTALNLQAPTPPALGVNALYGPSVALVLGVPVFVFPQFPGYVFPVAITTVTGAPFFPSFTVPFGFFGAPSGITIGTCPNGQPPQATPGAFGQIVFTC
jgi:hypothetical protein